MSDFYSICYTKTFVRSLAGLPSRVRDDFEKTLAVFVSNPADGRLRVKKLKGDLAGFYSMRVGNEYRALFQLGGRRSVEFVDISHRKDVYR